MNSNPNIVDPNYFESHIPVLEFFIDKIKPKFCVELGCGYFTTPYLDRAKMAHLAFDSRVEYMDKVEKELNLTNTDFMQYSVVYDLIKEMESLRAKYDLGVIGGPIPDRVLFCQSLLDVGCKCVLLLDYEQESLCGYRKIRTPRGYDFRVFQNKITNAETGVYLFNYLNAVTVPDHV